MLIQVLLIVFLRDVLAVDEEEEEESSVELSAHASCIECICKVESGCKPVGCHMDVGSLSCGYFQIKKPSYIDCGMPGRKSGESITTAWKRCADNYQCAKQCVEAYTKRYSRGCSVKGCQQMARLHNGGPAGCRESATLGYWKKVKSCCGCS